jgi:hypothetical protein
VKPRLAAVLFLWCKYGDNILTDKILRHIFLFSCLFAQRKNKAKQTIPAPIAKPCSGRIARPSHTGCRL